MKERPILFSGPMVRAILDGSKTQTRRVVKPQPTRLEWFQHQKGWLGSFGDDAGSATNPHRMVPCPYGQPGDRLWVKETFTISSCGTAVYRADARDQRGDRWHSIEPGDPKKEVRWKPSIFCTRAASRILLEITGIGVERLQEISEEDAIAEGVDWTAFFNEPAEAYAKLWEKINGPGSWDANPFVWVIEFRQIGGEA